MTKPKSLTTEQLFREYESRLARLERRNHGSGLRRVVPSSVAAGAVIGANGDVIFEATTAVAVDGVFDAGLSRYRVMIDVQTLAGASTLFAHMRTGGVANTDAFYNYARNYNFGGTPTSIQSVNQTRFEVMGATGILTPSGSAIVSMDIFTPANPFRTRFTGQSSQIAGPTVAAIGGYHDTTALFDGIQFSTAGVQMSGRLSVYAYN